MIVALKIKYFGIILTPTENKRKLILTYFKFRQLSL